MIISLCLGKDYIYDDAKSSGCVVVCEPHVLCSYRHRKERRKTREAILLRIFLFCFNGSNYFLTKKSLIFFQDSSELPYKLAKMKYLTQISIV